MNDPDSEATGYQIAALWTSRITTVVVEMVGPGILGGYLDHYWNTNFLSIAGFMLGVPLGTWHLLQMAAVKNEKTTQKDVLQKDEIQKDVIQNEPISKNEVTPPNQSSSDKDQKP